MIIEKTLKVDSVTVLSVFCLEQMSGPHFDLPDIRISEIEETSLYIQSIRRVYVLRKQRAYWRWNGVQEWLLVFCDYLSSFSTNNLCVYSRFRTSCKMISV